MSRRNASVVAFFLALAALNGCGKDEDKKTTPAAAPAPQSTPQVGNLSGNAWTSVSEQADCTESAMPPARPGRGGASNLPTCVNGRVQFIVNQDGTFSVANGVSGQLPAQEFAQVRSAVISLSNQDLMVNSNCEANPSGGANPGNTATGTNTSLGTGTNTSSNTGTNTSSNTGTNTSFNTATATNTNFNTGTSTNTDTGNAANVPFEQVTIALNNGARAQVWDSAAQANSARLACMDRTSLSKISQLRTALTPLLWKYAAIPQGSNLNPGGGSNR